MRVPSPCPCGGEVRTDERYHGYLTHCRDCCRSAWGVSVCASVWAWDALAAQAKREGPTK